jgi:hypothetical protein
MIKQILFEYLQQAQRQLIFFTYVESKKSKRQQQL